MSEPLAEHCIVVEGVWHNDDASAGVALRCVDCRERFWVTDDDDTTTLEELNKAIAEHRTARDQLAEIEHGTEPVGVKQPADSASAHSGAPTIPASPSSLARDDAQ